MEVPESKVLGLIIPFSSCASLKMLSINLGTLSVTKMPTRLFYGRIVRLKPLGIRLLYLSSTATKDVLKH